MILPGNKYHLREEELNGIKQWALENNLTLNENKSVEIIFTRPREKSSNIPLLANIKRESEIKILGITITSKLSLSPHITNIITSCTRTIYFLKTLRSRGITCENLQHVYKTIILPKILYASQAWWGFTTHQERERLDNFVQRSKKWNYCSSNTSPVTKMAEKFDKTLFQKIESNKTHKLRQLFPERKESKHNLRNESYNFPSAKSNDYKNFISRTILKNIPH